MSVTQSPKQTRARLALSGLGLFLLAALLCAALLLSLAIGSVNIPLTATVRILMGADLLQTQASWYDIVWQFRLPKALAATSAGAALAVSGLLIQTLFRNPLAGPSILGINAGAGLGVALAVLSGGIAEVLGLPQVEALSDIGVAFAASLGAIAATLVVLAVARQVQNSMALLIFGVMFGYATTALVTTLLHFSVVEQTQAYLAWTFGSFAGVTWQQLEILLPVVIIAIAVAQAFAKALNLILQGESHALSLGLDVRRARLGIIVSAATLAGCVTAFCGPIAFIGIAVPHLCRSLFQTLDRRVLIPAVTLMGAILALLADIIAQLPGSETVLPLNAVTALVGAPIISWLILKRQYVFR